MNWTLLIVGLSIATLFGCGGQLPGDGEPLVQCEDVRARGQLNVFTINLLFSEIETRDRRLDAITDFVTAMPVDVVLLQEVVGGKLVDTTNSAFDLQGKLRDRGHEYDLRTAFETGVPGLLAVANAVLSRCEIDMQMVKRLPRASELVFRGRDVKLARNVMMTRLNIPELGKVNIYNTHLCANCGADELNVQLDVLLRFIEDVEEFFPQDNPVILGGDFNIDRFRNSPFDQRPFYETIIDADFTDAYAEDKNVEDLCKDPSVADIHCTIGVTSLSIGASARRIDYIFVKEVEEINTSRVVFNTLVDSSQPTVSDHAGVFVSIELP